MDGDFVLDLDEVMDSLENGEVISLSFQTFNKALVVDTRCSEREGPLVCVCPIVESPRERMRVLRKMRPAFPRANNLTVIPWPKSVASLVSLGVWDKLISRFEREGQFEAVRDCATVLAELRSLERSEVTAVLTGENYHTIWSATP